MHELNSSHEEAQNRRKINGCADKMIFLLFALCGTVFVVITLSAYCIITNDCSYCYGQILPAIGMIFIGIVAIIRLICKEI